MEREYRVETPAIGGSSLLVIFAVLCLTVFALLGLSTVQADGRLSRAAAEATLAYYEADCRAEEIYARIRAGEVPDGVEPCSCGKGYAYVCPVSETQQLWVEVHRNGEDWTVARWQTRSVAEWKNDESLTVWDGT